MRNVIYSMMVTVDGFIARPDGDLNWGAVDEELHRFANELDSKVGAHLYGRRTYEVMNDFWSSPEAEAPSTPDYVREYTAIWRSLPKFVFSRTLESVGENATLIRDNIADEVKKLKQQPGNDLVVGGASLAASFMELGLIDEYQLFVHPVLLGRGIPMFPERDGEQNLRLVETHKFASGVIFHRYRKA